MKHTFYSFLIATCLTSCASYHMPPFSNSGQWSMEGNAVINKDAKIFMDCSFLGESDSIMNANNGSKELNFIASQESFNQYDSKCVKMVKNVLKDIPLTIDSIEVIFADQFIVLDINQANLWRPDCYRKADGSEWVEQAWPVSSLKMPDDQMWRNLIFNSKEHRLITVDRFVKQGRHMAIVQIFQSESKNAPWVNWGYDITDKRNIQQVGSNLEWWFQKWANVWQNDY